jgi:hypothetical protein
MCKICGGINNFLPREMKKKCVHCGIECNRCEKKEDLDTKTYQPEK